MAKPFDNFTFENFNVNRKENFFEELREKAQKITSKNKNNYYEPILVDPNSRKSLCKSWWGKFWCKNLERYADYENRIERGRKYLRNGAVIDLKIKGSDISANVLGGGWKPYKVKIKIDALPEKQRLLIEKQASGKLQDLESLINGNFPKDLEDLFFQKSGLFPSPAEIHFDCTCPDWADMCKHVAAALYGVGVRLDSNPLYFFQMRGINIDMFVDKVINGKVQNMLANANVDSPRIIKNADLLQIFNLT